MTVRFNRTEWQFFKSATFQGVDNVSKKLFKLSSTNTNEIN